MRLCRISFTYDSSATQEVYNHLLFRINAEVHVHTTATTPIPTKTRLDTIDYKGGNTGDCEIGERSSNLLFPLSIGVLRLAGTIVPYPL